MDTTLRESFQVFLLRSPSMLAGEAEVLFQIPDRSRQHPGELPAMHFG